MASPLFCRPIRLQNRLYSRICGQIERAWMSACNKSLLEPDKAVEMPEEENPPKTKSGGFPSSLENAKNAFPTFPPLRLLLSID